MKQSQYSNYLEIKRLVALYRKYTIEVNIETMRSLRKKLTHKGGVREGYLATTN